jgi:predicted RNase H-like HicB family nuclease
MTVSLNAEGNMARSFTVRAQHDAESGWYAGEVVELPGCYSQGPDLPSLEANIKEAIVAYLQTTEVDVPLSDFVGTLRIEVRA